MNYSVFRLQPAGPDGKPGIFWSREKASEKKKNFNYKVRSQPFEVRKHPRNYDKFVEEDNFLKPKEPTEDEKSKKPTKNFIKKNKENFARRDGRKKTQSAGDKTVTLTQEQLNAILASVGKVASGKEDALRILIDADKNEIKIDSPRRDGGRDDDEEDSLHSHEAKKESKKPRRRKEKDEEGSIFALLGDKKKSRQKNAFKDKDDDSFLKSKNERYRHVDENERDSDNKKKLKERSRRQDDEDDDDNEDDDRRGRKHNHSKERKNRDDYFREKRDKHNDSEEKKERRDYSQERNERTTHDDRSEGKDKRSKINDDRAKSNINDNKEMRRDESPPKDDKITPRDVLGLPPELSWKHMTKAERYRLMMVRQKMTLEEERKEEEKKSNVLKQYLDKNENKNVHHGADSRVSTIATDDSYSRPSRRSEKESRNRKRSPTPEKHNRTPSRERRDQSPEESSLQSNLKVDFPPPPSKVSLAEKKRQQWAKERVESQMTGNVDYDPWGRPGAGAPLRSGSGKVLADYRSRQDVLKSIAEGEETRRQEKHLDKTKELSNDEARHTEAKDLSSSEAQHTKAKDLSSTETKSTVDQTTVPHAMRSSFAFGMAPNENRYSVAQEQERKQWLADLERQIQEKKAREAREMGNEMGTKDDMVWADKLSQIPHGGGAKPEFKDGTNRASSAPDPPMLVEEEKTFIRGQNIIIDPLTNKEMEEKRQRHLEHQAAVMAQVQEQQRQRQAEREKKMREDMEEERRLQQERDNMRRQFEQEQHKIKMKEQQRQMQINQLKVAMDEAQNKAMQEKYIRKMEHLERGGHDTTMLRANLEAKITPRGAHQMESTHIPSLDLGMSPRGHNQPSHHQAHIVNTSTENIPWQDREMHHQPYLENRILTPTQHRKPSKLQSDLSSPKREFGTQTGTVAQTVARDDDNERLNREESEIQIEYKHDRGKKVRVISAPKEEVMRRTQKVPPIYTDRTTESEHIHHHHHHHMKQKQRKEKLKEIELTQRKLPVRDAKRPKWNYQNREYKNPVKQSEKDPFFEQRKRESDYRRLKREKQLIAMVEANKGIIPDYRHTPSHSREMSPSSDVGGRTPRGEQKTPRRARSLSPARLESSTDFLAVHHESSPRKKHTSQPSNKERTRSPDDRSRSHKIHDTSPIVPALRHRLDSQRSENQENYIHPITQKKKGGKYGDIDPLDVPVRDGDFAPFTRTIDILDPRNAREPMPLSREGTQIKNARKAYHDGLQPAGFGNKVEIYEDRIRMPVPPGDSKNPLLNPGLVTTHPTNRQDMILQQLSNLKQNLMQRQRELETFSPTDLE
ncbi:hypothetical protein CHS0354_027829 [Potamilus streckersoni]|uniref:CCDC66 domain-containing protein n=1 Tax=Potamilus streckersoni TaxID=2493646 RepID=A0AAE0T0S0_9BIVA|nr:hypothetical protein CHS0354_027829 [Potamilus streckersoni]